MEIKKTIAKWLRNVADKLTGEQTIDIAIAKEIQFKRFASEATKGTAINDMIELSNRLDCDRERAWVHDCILAGVRKQSYNGILRWEEDITETGAVIGARIRIISPIVINKKKSHENI